MEEKFTAKPNQIGRLKKGMPIRQFKRILSDYPKEDMKWPYRGSQETLSLKIIGPWYNVVFDAAAKYGNVSLNVCLMTGPALLNYILDVLIRFREDRVAITADIKAMFSRVQLKAEDGRFHRFFLRANPADPLEVFQMRGVVFGDSPSPCVAISILLRTAEDNHCSEMIKQTIKQQFYVDDYLDSGTDPLALLKLAKDVQQVLSAGNFNLRGWTSNSSLYRIFRR